MASVNKVILLGNLGRDPELRNMPNGDAAVAVSLATTRKWKDKGGEKQEETEWHRVTAFGRTAEVICEYVKKGDPLYVEGRLRTRKWTDKDGVEKYTTEIVVDQMQLLGNHSAPQREQSAPRQQSAPQRQAPPQRPPARQAAPAGGGGGFDGMDDDVPFVTASPAADGARLTRRVRRMDCR